jgi:dCMP deaminase
MNVAGLTADLSYAKELKVGCVAVLTNRIICCGFNGRPPNRDNACELTTMKDGEVVLITHPEVEHAEMNLITYAAKNGIALCGAYLYCTHSPCMRCARAIFNSGFTRLYFHEYFKNMDGLNFLEEMGVVYEQL